MSILVWPPKLPAENLDYIVDWSARLVSGEVIAASAWTVPAGITKGADTHTGALTTVWLSGGDLNTTYQFSNTVTTSVGRVLSQTIELYVGESYAPAVSWFKARFTEFAEISDTIVQAAIREASRFVTTAWPVRDREIAIALLAAHFLFLAQEQAGGSVGDMISRMRSISYGPMSVGFTTSASSSSQLSGITGETSSIYLERFRMLLPDPWSPIVLDGSHH